MRRNLDGRPREAAKEPFGSSEWKAFGTGQSGLEGGSTWATEVLVGEESMDLTPVTSSPV